MAVSRQLPHDLTAQLRRARALEHLAETLEQVRNAAVGTSVLMLAAVNAGWHVTDTAKVLDMPVGTASKRVWDARKSWDNLATGLVLDEPQEVRGKLAELSVPETDRQWLSRGEAARYLGVAGRTVQSYYLDGLLPDCRTMTGTQRVYLRADLERVRLGPRRGVYLDRVAMLALVTTVASRHN